MYAYTTDVPINEEMYRRIRAEIGPEPMVGAIVHMCVRREDGSLYYIDVWESEDACTRAFDERIHPAVNRAFGGARPNTEPTTHALDVVDVMGQFVGS